MIVYFVICRRWVLRKKLSSREIHTKLIFYEKTDDFFDFIEHKSFMPYHVTGLRDNQQRGRIIIFVFKRFVVFIEVACSIDSCFFKLIGNGPILFK